MPSAIHFHLISSSESVSWTFCTRNQRDTNSAISSAVDILHNPLVHLSSFRASQTVVFFLHASLYKLGARSLGARPLILADSQNFASFPLPTVTYVLARKSCLPCSLQGTSVPTQGRSGSLHWYQSQRSLNALLKNSISITPIPPSRLGLLTLAHRTRQ